MYVLSVPAFTRLGAQKYHPGVAVSQAQRLVRFIGSCPGDGGLIESALSKISGVGRSPVAIKLQPATTGPATTTTSTGYNQIIHSFTCGKYHI